MEFLQKLLQGNAVEVLLVALIVINAALSGLSKAFEAIGKSDKVPSWAATAAKIAQKLVDLISANRAHK
jgi:hypothetical protein